MKTTTKCYATSAPGVTPPINGAVVSRYESRLGLLWIFGKDGEEKWYQLGEIDRIIVREGVEE